MKRMFCLVLSIWMILSCLPVSVLATEAQEPTSEVIYTGISQPISEQFVLSQAGISAYALDAYGNPALASGNHVRWVDRLAGLPGYATDFFAWLQENSDGDGTQDALIDVTTAENIDGEYVCVITTKEHEFAVEVPAGSSKAEAVQLCSEAVEAAMNKTYREVAAYTASVYEAFNRDHPEVFWLDGVQSIGSPAFSYSIENRNGTYWVKFTQSVTFSLQEESFDIRQTGYRTASAIRSDISRRDSAIGTILSGIPEGSTTSGKVTCLNDWLTGNNSYNSSSDLSKIDASCRECTGALFGRTGKTGPVCEAYSRALKVLCDRLGIPCVLVDGAGHMWNNVKLEDGKWYAVDVTWNDPTVSGINSAVSGYECHDYLFVGADTVIDGETFLQSHPVENQASDGGVSFTNGPVLSANAFTGEAVCSHSYGSWQVITSPTCTGEGQERRECENCGETETREKAATGHTEVTDSAVAATCTESGLTEGKHCSVCGIVTEKQETVKAAGHKWNEGTVTKEPTEATEGVRSFACTVCGAAKTESIPVLEHSHKYTAVVTAPTCTEKGFTTHTCTCGDSYTDTEVSAKGHSYSGTGHTTPPTCTEKGYTTYSCIACSDSYQDNYVDATGVHTYSDDADTTCDVCGASRSLGDDGQAEFPFTDAEWEVLKLTNAEREKEGLLPLTGHALLQKAGDIRATELTEYYSHTRPDGTDCFSVLDELGIRYGYAGENIYNGPRTASQAVTGWMNSSGHRANILSSNFGHIAVGNEGTSWVQMFISGGSYKSMKILAPTDLAVNPGTSIDSLNLVAMLGKGAENEFYLPVRDSYCTGYHSDQSGDQTVTVSVLGVSATFVIHVHDWDGAGCGSQQTCKLCGATQNGAKEHSFGQWAVSKVPTCTEPGEERRECTTCGQSETREIAAKGHTEVTDQAKAPTCTESGLAEGRHCSDCGTVLKAQETVPPAGHSYDSGTVTKQPTETAEGEKTFTCTACGATKTKSIPKLDHKHQYTAKVTAPTCTEKGYTTHTCSCGDTYTDTEVPAKGHSYDSGTITKQPTETAEGEKTFTCTVCGATKTESIPKLDHKHQYTAKVTAPTCTEKGYTTHTCTCGDSYRDSYVEAAGHTYAKFITKPTCAAQGYTTYVCSGCQDTYDGDYVAATGTHTYSGALDATCDVCGAVRELEDNVPEERPFTDAEWQALKLINEKREKAGVSPLTGGALIQKAASTRIQELKQQYTSTRPDGSYGYTVLDEVGLSYWYASMYTCSGYQTAEQVVEAWTDSTYGPSDLLSTVYSHMGIGNSGSIWVGLLIDGTGYTSISVSVPGTLCVEPGMTIEDMDLVAVLQGKHGVCYLPVRSAYCQGYDPNKTGDQTVKISVLGVSNTFTIHTPAAEEEVLWGDVSGDGFVDSYDAALILKYDVMLIGDSDLDLAAADVSGDGFVDSYDASLILKFDVMLIDKFPAEG